MNIKNIVDIFLGAMSICALIWITTLLIRFIAIKWQEKRLEQISQEIQKEKYNELPDWMEKFIDAYLSDSEKDNDQ